MNRLNITKIWNKEKEKRKLLYDEYNDKNIKQREPEKFCSFLKNSLVPKGTSYKFPFVLNNSKWCYLKEIRTKNPTKRLTHNEEVTIILYTMFYALYFCFLFFYEEALLELEYDLEHGDNTNLLFLFNNSIFYYFLNSSLYELYISNIDLKYFIYAYSLDLKYNYNYLILFNYYIFFFSLIFFVLLNLGLIKYEHDKALTPEEKWDKILKMDIDFFDYSEFINYNINDDSLLVYQDSIYCSLCIYEFHLDFIFYFCNIFNLYFFHKVSLKKKRVKKKFISRNYLSKVWYNSLKSENEHSEDEFSKCYDEFSLMLLSNNKIKGLNYYNNIMDIRSFMMRIPHLFFVLYTFYTIYYRLFRYNLYIRSYYFFEEYTCKKKYFILHNNPYGKNKTKVTFWKYQKLWTVNFFRLYLEQRIFNKWFLFYSSHIYNLKRIVTNDNLTNLYSFNNLLNDLNLNLLLNINNIEEYAQDFYFDNILGVLKFHNIVEGYKLAMRVKSNKFSRCFKLGRAGFLDLDEYFNMMYTLPFDVYLYYKNENKLMYFNFILELYNFKFMDFYFLKDLFNLNDKISHMKSYKMVNLYNKLTYLSFYIVDPFCLKYFWRKYFPRQLKQLRRIYDYTSLNLVQLGVRRNTRQNVLNYDFFHYYFNWRTDSSTSVQSNMFYEDKFTASLSISNIIVRSRFVDLLDKLKFILNFNNIFSMQRLQNLVLFLKNYYAIILGQNIDFIFYIFFFNITMFLNIQNNTNIWFNANYIIDNTLMYRYYVYFLLFEFNYYSDWFNNKEKRVLWIFHKKHYKSHEGLLFYKSKYNEIF